MAGRAVKNWYLVHRWTSVICMVFLLMLCITGLPLIFYTEIEQLLGEAPVTRILPVGRSYVPLDEVVAAAQAQHPGDAVQYVTYDEVNPDIVYITLGRTPASDDTHFVTLDVRTAEILNVPQFENTALYVFFELHVDMFAGLPGELFLGLMGLLFVASIVSGIVVYGPFMRRLNFGTVRRTRARRLLWLDLHNLLGIAITMWMLVVGFTGVLNTLATPILQMWQVDQLADLVAPYKGRPAPAALSSVGDAVATARAAAPNLEPSFIAYPGTLFSSKHHYAVFLKGKIPLTSRLFKPGLVDAETGAFTDTRDMPWYASALFVSRPLHFGDFGGLPLKILWGLLDIVTIVILVSGVYLWLGRRRSSLETRVTEILCGGATVVTREK